MQSWILPPLANADFVCQMEQVLSVYERPYDSQNPVVCLDETTKQLIEQVEQCLKNGQRIADYTYIRHGVQDIYVMSEPLAGKRKIYLEENHNRLTWVKVVAESLDTSYKEVKKITLIQDNLKAHKPSAFYEVFEAEKAKAYLDRIEFVFTPKHGSWLNMAEIEFSILQRKCLQKHIADKAELEKQIRAWEKQRNEANPKIQWQFTNQEARIKLRKLYPTI